jgi:predicted membrane protein
MMRSVLSKAFSSSVTQADKNAARHLRSALLETRSEYQSVLFDILGLTATGDRTALAEMAFLIGMQAGYELGLTYPAPPKI